MTPPDPKTRFTDRVNDYVRFRPGYPSALLDELTRVGRLGPGCVVADLGSGTGIFTRLLLDRGARVLAIEPNAAMRKAAEAALSREPGFMSLDASAEATTLADGSVDIVTVAQAFHWFEADNARNELARILRPEGYVALIWNKRRDTPFNRDYESMLERMAPDYAKVREKDRAAESTIRAFFAPSDVTFARFDNQQLLDEASLRGRFASSSYVPRPGEARHAEILVEVAAIFARHHDKGQVAVLYDTVLWYGHLSPAPLRSRNV